MFGYSIELSRQEHDNTDSDSDINRPSADTPTQTRTNSQWSKGSRSQIACFRCGVINKCYTTHPHLESTAAISHGDNREQISRIAAETKRQKEQKERWLSVVNPEVREGDYYYRRLGLRRFPGKNPKQNRQTNTTI